MPAIHPAPHAAPSLGLDRPIDTALCLTVLACCIPAVAAILSEPYAWSLQTDTAPAALFWIIDYALGLVAASATLGAALAAALCVRQRQPSINTLAALIAASSIAAASLATLALDAA
ncbi:MAG: hypothetical protein AAF078_10615 [Planctomycetota bacterium]